MFKKITFIALMTVCLAGCTDMKSARKALETNGMSNIKLDDWSPWFSGCDESFSTSFTATNFAGNRVSGVVCTTLFGSSHIRTY